MFAQGDNRFDVAWDEFLIGTLYGDRYASFASSINFGRSFIRLVPQYNYTDVGESSSVSYEDYLKAWIKKICIDFPTATYTAFVGNVFRNGAAANSSGIIACYIGSCASLTDGLPQYATGIVFTYGSTGIVHRFGTDSYSFWHSQITPDGSEEVALSYSTNNIVTSANFSSGVKLYKSGKACALHIQFTPTSTSGGSSYVTIGTIPSGSRPQQQVDVATHLDSTTFRLIDLRVTTTGNIQVYKNNTYTQTLRGNLAWITA